MSLAHYRYVPLISGGVEVSQGDNTEPFSVVLDPGEASHAIATWLCTGAYDKEYTGITVDPVDLDLAAPDLSGWVQLAEAEDGVGMPGAWGLPGDAITISGTVGPGPSVYRKHWMRVTVPSGTTSEVVTSIKLSVTGNAQTGLW